MLRSDSKSDARVTASVDDMVVFPTPPLPPTKTVRGGLPGDGLDADWLMSLIRLEREKRRVLLRRTMLVSSSTVFPTKLGDLLLLLQGVDIDAALVGNIKGRAGIDVDLVVGTWNPKADGGMIAARIPIIPIIPMAGMVACGRRCHITRWLTSTQGHCLSHVVVSINWYKEIRRHCAGAHYYVGFLASTATVQYM